MPSSPELLRVAPNLWIWQVFDPAVKSELFATAIGNGVALFVIDPIPLERSLFEEIETDRAVEAVLVTNANHLRAAPEFALRLGCPILATSKVLEEFAPAEGREIPAGGRIAPGVTAIPIEGAAAGEAAFHFADDGGTIVLGDALINFDPYGFTFLPAKYCSDQRAMRRSLRQLLDWSCERLLFAHGTPILSGGRARLETLLG